MTYLLGTDEAGYGPNLGPLVVTAVLWQVPAGTSDDALYELLRDVVTDVPTDDGRLYAADSKRVYSAGRLEALEHGVLTALGVCGLQPADLGELLDAVAPGCDAEERRRPWHAEPSVRLPLAVGRESIAAAGRRLRAGLAAAGVALCAVRCRCLFPADYNRYIEHVGNKSTLLTATTLELVGELLDGLPSDDAAARPATIACDKHGGRNAYATALQYHLADGLVQTMHESRAESCYRLQRAGRELEIGFRVRGESRLQTALASMTSKYVREAAMHAWNTFWTAAVPNLRPTAGYPTDARRFRRDVADEARRRRLDERLWWRVR